MRLLPKSRKYIYKETLPFNLWQAAKAGEPLMCALKTSNEMDQSRSGRSWLLHHHFISIRIPGEHVRTAIFKLGFFLCVCVCNEFDGECVSDFSVCICIK